MAYPLDGHVDGPWDFWWETTKTVTVTNNEIMSNPSAFA